MVLSPVKIGESGDMVVVKKFEGMFTGSEYQMLATYQWFTRAITSLTDSMVI